MHILLTNDDGIDAPGLAALEQAVRQFAGADARLTVAAPHKGYSGCGHQVTCYEPIHVEEVGPQRYKVFGTPADCTRLGIRQLASDVDFVLAGVNAGGNLGVDVYMSGTVAAIREAVWLNKPGIAVSQYMRRDRERDWPRSAAMTVRVLEQLVEWVLATPAGEVSEFWNANLPDVDTPVGELKIVDTIIEPLHMDVSFEQSGSEAWKYVGDYRGRPRTPGSDVSVCFGGDISVSKIVASP